MSELQKGWRNGESSREAYVDPPELFDGVKRHHFLQQIVPVIALCEQCS